MMKFNVIHVRFRKEEGRNESLCAAAKHAATRSSCQCTFLPPLSSEIHQFHDRIPIYLTSTKSSTPLLFMTIWRVEIPHDAAIFAQDFLSRIRVFASVFSERYSLLTLPHYHYGKSFEFALFVSLVMEYRQRLLENSVEVEASARVRSNRSGSTRDAITMTEEGRWYGPKWRQITDIMWTFLQARD